MTKTTNPTRPPDAEAFPSHGTFREKATFLLDYATRAPSGHNSQPWLFSIGEDRMDVFADRRRALPVVDPFDRELAISCGAAIGTLEAAARCFGFETSVDVFAMAVGSDRLARVSFGPLDRRAPASVLRAIADRRTTRTAYGPMVPPEALIGLCRNHAARHGVQFTVFESDAERAAIAALVAQGDEMQFDDPAFCRELASWVHSTTLGSRDGVSAAAFGTPDILAPVARFVMRTFDMGGGIAAADADRITAGTAMLGLLSSAQDTQEAAVETGRALADILIALTEEGFTASYLNQPIEVAQLRSKLREVTGVAGHPQILLRIGLANETPPPTVRRDVADVIV